MVGDRPSYPNFLSEYSGLLPIISPSGLSLRIVIVATGWDLSLNSVTHQIFSRSYFATHKCVFAGTQSSFVELTVLATQMFCEAADVEFATRHLF